MQEDPKRVDPYAAADRILAGAIDRPGPHDDEGDPKSSTVFHDDLILLDLCEAIRVAPALGVLLDWRGLIQQPPPGVPRIAVDGERTDVHESAQAFAPEARIQKIARGDDRIHERIGK